MAWAAQHAFIATLSAAQFDGTSQLGLRKPSHFLSWQAPPLICLSSSSLYPSPLQKWRAAAEPQRSTKEEKFELPDFFEIDKDVASLSLLFESAQISKAARHYEAVFLVHEDHVDELQDVTQKVKDFIEKKKGKIYRFNDWGMRKLAYKIRKAKRANYILMNFQIDAKEINDFKSLLDKDERIIRHLVMTKKKAETAETVSPPEYSSIRDEENLDEEYEEYNSEEELEEGSDDEEEDGEDEELEEAKVEELAQV